MPGIDPRGGGRSADALLADARRRASRIRRDAEREAAAIRREAAAWAAATRRDAEQYRDQILRDLEVLAQQLEAETDTLVAHVLREAEDRVAAGSAGQFEVEGEVIDIREAVGGTRPIPRVTQGRTAQRRTPVIETSLETKVNDVVRLAIQHTFERSPSPGAR